MKQQNQLLDSEKSQGSESVDKLKMLVVQLEKNKDKLVFELQSANEKAGSVEREKKKFYENLKGTKEKLVNAEQELVELKDGQIKVTVDRDKMQSKLDERDEELVALREKYEEVYQLYSDTKLKYTQSEGNSSNMIYR